MNFDDLLNNYFKFELKKLILETFILIELIELISNYKSITPLNDFKARLKINSLNKRLSQKDFHTNSL